MGNDVEPAVTVCGECKASLDVVSGKVGEIVQNLRNGHAATQVIENVGHCDARATNARLTATNLRVNRDALSVIHVVKLGFQAC